MNPAFASLMRYELPSGYKVIHTPRKTFRDWAAERFKTNLADRLTRHYQTDTVFLEISTELCIPRFLMKDAKKGI